MGNKKLGERCFCRSPVGCGCIVLSLRIPMKYAAAAFLVSRMLVSYDWQSRGLVAAEVTMPYSVALTARDFDSI